jgi:hypothetical protein
MRFSNLGQNMPIIIIRGVLHTLSREIPLALKTVEPADQHNRSPSLQSRRLGREKGYTHIGSGKLVEIEFLKPSSTGAGGSILIWVREDCPNKPLFPLPSKSPSVILSSRGIGSGRRWPPYRLELGLMGANLPVSGAPIAFA